MTLALLGALPLLLGADGCIEDLTVAIEEAPVVQLDAGIPGSDASVPSGPCEPSECPILPPDLFDGCPDGQPRPEPACERDTEGVCGWVFADCPVIEDAGLPDCDAGECGPVVWFVPASTSDSSPLESLRTCEAGASVCRLDAEGACIVECVDFPACGDRADACGASDYCAHALGSCGGSGASGVCLPRATGCTKEYVPVCGCDGVTYGNACLAYGAGVNIAYESACVAVPSP